MSDQHNENHGGGHEVDQPPTRELFNIVWGLGALTLLSIVTCVQLFNQQRDTMLSESMSTPSYRLAEYRAEQDKRLSSNGSEELLEDGKTVTLEYVPLEVAAKNILAKPELLQAPPPPPGWIHPDDIASGGAKAPVVAPPAPAAGEEAAVEGAPAEGASAPAEGAASGPATAEGAAQPASPAAESVDAAPAAAATAAPNL